MRKINDKYLHFSLSDLEKEILRDESWNKKRGILSILIYFLIMVLGLGGIIAGVYIKGNGEGLYLVDEAIFINFIIYGILMFLIIPLNLLEITKGFKVFLKGLVKDKTYKKLLGYLAVFILLSIYASVMTNKLLTNFDILTSENQGTLNSFKTSPYYFLIVIITVILAPLIEEIIFRESIFGIFKNKIIAVILSILLFGLVHLRKEVTGLYLNFNLTDFKIFLVMLIPYLTSGIYFTYLYFVEKDLFYPVVVHGLGNLFSVLMTVFLFL